MISNSLTIAAGLIIFYAPLVCAQEFPARVPVTAGAEVSGFKNGHTSEKKDKILQGHKRTQRKNKRHPKRHAKKAGGGGPAAGKKEMIGSVIKERGLRVDSDGEKRGTQGERLQKMADTLGDPSGRPGTAEQKPAPVRLKGDAGDIKIKSDFQNRPEASGR